MKGIFWNANGFRDPAKHRFVSDLTKQYNLSFIAISETCRRDFTDPFLKNLNAGKNFLWHVKEPNGRSGGILMGIDLQVSEIAIKLRLCCLVKSDTNLCFAGSLNPFAFQKIPFILDS